ncbi:hypothetical protein [Nonomuraea dietziae]
MGHGGLMPEADQPAAGQQLRGAVGGAVGGQRHLIHRRRLIGRLFGEDFLDHLLGHPQPVQVVFGLGQLGAQAFGAFGGCHEACGDLGQQRHGIPRQTHDGYLVKASRHGR